jgi:hypothetical protein
VVVIAAVLLPGCPLRKPSEATPAGQADGGPLAVSRVWGVTIDDPWNLEPTLAALQRLSRRVTARVVFDEGQPASGYVPLVTAIHGAAEVMGEVLDSQYVAGVTVASYLARTREYLDALGGVVDVWEIANEVNGEWLGASSDVVAKARGAYDLVKARGKRTALTLYYNRDCWSSPSHEMFTWVEGNLPEDMRAGLDWVLVSYYEDDCNGLQPDWNAEFRRLAAIFPNARLGIGECGTRQADRKAAYLQRYYSLHVDEPRFIGGFFWWYFSEDMVPWTAPLWKTLDDLLKKG